MKTDMGFSFSSETDQWYTPEHIIRFAELLAGRITHDLCGMSTFWTPSLNVKQHGEGKDGINTFTRTRELVGGDIFANPAYGWLPAQTVSIPMGMEKINLDYLPKVLSRDDEMGTIAAPVPGSKVNDPTLERDQLGFYSSENKKGERVQVSSRIHSAHTFAHYLLKLWEDGVIRSAFLVIPSATDTKGHDQIFKSVGYTMNTVSRLSFLTPGEDGEFKKVNGNTKGTSLIWLPPFSYNMDTEAKWVSRLTTVRSMMGSDFPNINLSKYVDF